MSEKSVDGFLAPFKLLEIDFDLIDSRAERVKKIRWIIRLRYAVSAAVVALMFVTAWGGLTRHPDMTRNVLAATLATGVVAFALNMAYQVALRRRLNLSAFVFLQLFIDLLIFTSYVYRTGGAASPFSFLYLLPIIAGAILASGRTALTLAATASCCYGALAVLGGLGALPPVSYFGAMDPLVGQWSYVALMLIVNPFAFFTVAGLASFLMKEVRSKTDALTEATLKLDAQSQRLQMLYQVARSSVYAKNHDAVVIAIGRLLVQGLNLDRVLFYLVSPEKDRLILEKDFYHPRLKKGSDDRAGLQVEIPLREDAGVTARCALTRRPENVTDPENHPLINRSLAGKIGMNPFALAPMVANRELIGVLGVDRSFKEGRISDDDFQVLIAFADQAAVTLRTARLERTLANEKE